ncbi:hypothetical protein BZG77_01115 [Salinivibrio sp. IB643]|nr:hypothetical protein BZG77_01115 [Salinivibrio sp. IB643]
MLTVVVFVGLFLNWRSALVVAIAIPISYGAALGLDLAFGYSINRVTLFALILALDVKQLVKQTQAGRCDVFLACYEILAGFKAAQGIDYLAGGMQVEPIPGNMGDKFYMMISREYPEANDIKALLDQNFESMRQSGQLKSILDGYLN